MGSKFLFGALRYASSFLFSFKRKKKKETEPKKKEKAQVSELFASLEFIYDALHHTSLWLVIAPEWVLRFVIEVVRF